MSVLTQDWLDALGILRREVYDIQHIFKRVDSISYSDKPQAQLYKRAEYPLTTELEAWLFPRHIEQAARIERVEAHLALACVVENYYKPRGINGYTTLRRKVGCAITTSSDIRERWRLIDWETPAHLLPLAVFEDRPKCKLCSAPCATGSGAWVKAGQDFSGPQLAVGSEIDWWNGLTADQRYEQQASDGELYLRYKNDVHEECMRYAHTVLVPARLEQIEAEKRKATAEVDK